MDVGIVVDALVLGQLDHHPAGADADLVQQVDGAAVEDQLVVETIEAGIDEQLAGQLQLGECAKDRLAARLFELAADAVALGGGEERQRRVQRRAERTADQPFVADVRMRAKVDDRLKNAGQPAILDDVFEQVDFLGAHVGRLAADGIERRKERASFERFGHGGRSGENDPPSLSAQGFNRVTAHAQLATALEALPLPSLFIGVYSQPLASCV